MRTRLIHLMAFVLVFGSVAGGATIHWTAGGTDRLWTNPDNWEGKKVPTEVDEAYIDVPAAAAPNGPIIEEGMEAKALGLACEVAGEPTVTMTGGTLEIADWIWWGDGAGSHGTFHMSGGTITVVNEHELGWGGGTGTWIMTGGTVSAGRLVIPTATGEAGQLYLHGGTYHVGSGGLSMTAAGLIDIEEGMLVLEGNRTLDIQGYIDDGRITAYGGMGHFILDYDQTTPGATTVIAIPDGNKANRPDPADGARDVSFPMLRWSAGLTAVIHEVYLGTSPDALESMGRWPVTAYYHLPGLEPGTTYFWRVDEVEGDGVTVHTGDVWSFTAPAPTAYYPDPADGANTVSPAPTLTWMPGVGAVQHRLYFGQSADAVGQGATETDKGTFALADTAFSPGTLETLATYFWRVDEILSDGTIQAGAVWSFTTALPVDDFESYNDDDNRIYDTWTDGWTNDTGSRVGYIDAPFAEQWIVHEGGQSMPLDYNNTAEPYYSETRREFSPAEDWMLNGVTGLVVHIRGKKTNAPAPLYVALEDVLNGTSVVTHPDPAVVTSTKWTAWQIPLGDFADARVVVGVKAISIGLGNKANPGPGGTGLIFIDDIRLTRRQPQ